MNWRWINRFFWSLVVCIVFVKQADGQESPWSLQYVSNIHTLNPAYVGIWDKAGLLVSTKSNWVGIKSAPLSQYITYFTPIKDLKSGVGLSIHRQNLGFEKRLSITGDYSYQVRLDMRHYLRMGLRAGIVNFDNNLTDYQLYPDRIPDPEFTTDIRLYNMTTFGMGAVFFSERYYIGISVPQIISNTFRVNKAIFSSLENTKTIYLNSGYVAGWRNSIRFRPNLLVVGTLGKRIFLDAGAIIYLPSELQFGFNLRSDGSFCASAQYSFRNRIRIGYAAEYAVISDIRKFQLGTYEILIGYDYNIFKRKYVKPNYF